MKRSIAIVVALALLPRAALAAPPPPTVGRCLDASEEGQRVRDEGKLSQSRALFEVCSSSTCPPVVRANCTKWLEGVAQAMPSIVVSARTDTGADVPSATLVVDEAPRELSGKPIEIDPGPHVVKVSAPGHRTSEQKIIAANGEKGRLVRMVLERTAPSPPTVETPPPAQSVAPPPASTLAPAEGGSGIPAISWILAGVGVAAGGVSLGLGLTARSDIRELEGSPCAATKTCSQDDVDAAHSRLVIADVMLGVAVASIVVAGVIWAFSGPADRK